MQTFGYISRLFNARQDFVQFAALPFRETAREIEIALVTSRGTGRWIVPKGWPEPGLSPSAVAANEAFEEAGLRGAIGEQPLGAFTYSKRLHLLASATCRVDVYALRVTIEHESWPECRQRTRSWFDRKTAANAVAEPQLADLIREFSPA